MIQLAAILRVKMGLEIDSHGRMAKGMGEDGTTGSTNNGQTSVEKSKYKKESSAESYRSGAHFGSL